MQRVGRGKSLQKQAKWAHKKHCQFKSKNWDKLISNYVIVLYVTRNLKYRNNSIP